VPDGRGGIELSFLCPRVHVDQKITKQLMFPLAEKALTNNEFDVVEVP
jgi:hypothetical protein